MKFLGRCLSTSTTPIPQPQIKPLSESLSSLLEDSFEGARNEAATCLGTLMKMVGERPLNALMDSLADVRKAKVKEAYEKATVKCKAGSAPKPAPPAAKEPPKKKAPAAAPPAVKKPEPEAPAADEELLSPIENKPLKKPPARLLVRFYCLCVRDQPSIILCRRKKPAPLLQPPAATLHHPYLLRQRHPLRRRSSFLPLPLLRRPARGHLLPQLVVWIPLSSNTRQKMLTHLLPR